MSRIQNPICEIHSIGRKTRERIISIRGVPFLGEFGISLAGVSETHQGFSWSRLNPKETQILATVSGAGEVWVKGGWKKAAPGFAYVTPPGTPHAYRAMAKRPWTVCWVTYQGKLRDAAAFLPPVPEIIPCAVRQLWHSVEGAFDAMAQHEMPTQLELWVRLMHHAVVRTLNAARSDISSHAPLWVVVNADLARAWTLEEFARMAGMSKENLRRVCQRDLGVSPMRHLTRLRPPARKSCSPSPRTN